MITDLFRENEMPLFYEEIMKLRKNVNGSYTTFCNVVLSQVLGKHDWKLNCGKKLLREYASSSDEAFGLLILENSWMMWKEMAEKNDNSEVVINKPKYTLNGAGTKKMEVGSRRGLSDSMNWQEK